MNIFEKSRLCTIELRAHVPERGVGINKRQQLKISLNLFVTYTSHAY